MVWATPASAVWATQESAATDWAMEPDWPVWDMAVSVWVGLGYGYGGLGYGGLGYGSHGYGQGSSHSFSKTVQASGHQGSGAHGHHGLVYG